MVRKTDTERLKLEFALTEGQYRDVLERLFGQTSHRPNDPERGFLAMVFPASGATRNTLILGEIIEPGRDDVYWSPKKGLVMAHQYYSRALTTIQEVPNAGLINIHSHPGPRRGFSPPAPSPQDLATDTRELCFASRALPETRITAAGIVTAGGGISVRQYMFLRPRTMAEGRSPRFGPAGAAIRFADRVRIVGPGLRVMNGNPERAADRAIDLTMTDSTALLWGEPGQKILAELSVGIAGLGGVGGMVAEQLARLGIGYLVLVDYDRLEVATFNRSQGVTRSEAEAQLPKVEAYARLAERSATAPNFRVQAFRASAAESEGLKHLLDCDIVVGTADDAFARQVLDHAAYAHLIPVIDGGTTLVPDEKLTRIVAGKSQIAAAGPAHACLECQGVYSQEEATIARESATWGEYLRLAARHAGKARKQLRAPSVICNNGLVASLIGLRILAIALRVTTATLRGTQRYYVEEGTLAWGAKKECASGCPKAAWTGFGDRHFIPVGVDLRSKEMREKEAANAK